LYITNAPVADVVLAFAAHPGRPRLTGWARVRRQFSQPIRKFQGVAGKVADL
jgi:alkylation response protein AidB-like acyl-CoA dehydrogenase